MTKILLVEDDKSLREIYGVRLLAEGYDIVSAGDGEEALAMAIKERPQLIVSDVMMPKISGFDMLDILRSTTETKDIKVIMMTALSSEDQRARGQALGADRYLVKSQVGIEDVVRTVHEVLADAPTSGATKPAFGPPAASMTPRPVSPVPARPTPPPASATPAPSSNPQPSFTQPSPAASGLPQPTAPFSGTRPASLGERVIHPITPVSSTGDIASRMNQELEAETRPTQPEPAAPTPPIPVVPQAPTPPSPVTAEPVTPPLPTPPSSPTNPTLPVPPAPPVDSSDTSGLQFEETPLPPANQPPANRAL